MAGHRLSLGDLKSDSYVVGAVNDHIVPWTTSYQATRLLGGSVRYVLSNGGHVAGIVNPPGSKAWHTVSPGPVAPYPAGAEQWRAAGADPRRFVVGGRGGLGRAASGRPGQTARNGQPTLSRPR